MKLRYVLGAALFVFVLAGSDLGAQSLKGMSLNGASGLYSIPSGRIAWEQSANIGFDIGYHAIFDNQRATHIPKVALSLFKWVELSAAVDIQPDGYLTADNGSDFIGGIKIQFPIKNTALALGGNFQSLNMGHDQNGYLGGQIYAAVTYAGTFFNMPAETTVVVGKTLREHSSNWDIDFGMGFDLVILPDTFNSMVHWITDFANFSYSVEAMGAQPGYRGVLNTGLRIDLAGIPGLSRFKFAADIMITDALDDNRAFAIGLVFGLPLLE